MSLPYITTQTGSVAANAGITSNFSETVGVTSPSNLTLSGLSGGSTSATTPTTATTATTSTATPAWAYYLVVAALIYFSWRHV